MKNHTRLIIFLTLLIVGCREINNTVTHTPTTQPAPTIPQSSIISDSCLENRNEPLGSLHLPGKLVVYTKKKYGLLDLEQNIFIELPETANVSPDGKKVAQFDEEKKGIVISDLEGAPLIFFEKKEEWTEANQILFGTALDFDPDYVRFDWWDNDSLFIRTLPVGSLLLLNMNNGEAREIIFPYSDEVYGFGFIGDIRDHFVSFSPNIDKVIYASTKSHLVLRNNLFYGDGRWRTIIWVGFSFTYSIPIWSPDSSTFVLAMNTDTRENIDDLYQVDSEFGAGERQLTNLGNLFNHPYQIWISQFDWAPNGEKIALIARVTPNEGDESLSRLLVLDVETGSVEDYCNPDPDNPYSTDGFSFTWSPDGKYIATDTMIVDLESRQAYKIPDVYIVDWVGEGRIQ